MKDKQVNNLPQKPSIQYTIHPDKVRAALGSATLLHSFLLHPQIRGNLNQQPQDQTQSPNTDDQQAPSPQPIDEVKTSVKDLETKFLGKLDELKDMIEQSKPKDANKELQDLKQKINDVLNEPDQAS